MKLQTEGPKPEWTKEVTTTAARPDEASDAKTGVLHEEKPNLGVRIVDTAKSVAHKLWEKKKSTCCVLPQNNPLLSEKCCIGKLPYVRQIREKLVPKSTEALEKV